MAVFDPHDDLSEAKDYWLLQDSSVTLVWSPAVLSSLVDWLTSRGYDARTVDTLAWASYVDLHRDIAAALDFPEYYGHNFNALDDCLFDVAHGEYGLNPTSAGLVLVLRHYEHFTTIDADSAHALLDYFARQARLGLVFGHRMICLVQTDNPRLSFPPVGGTGVRWNQSEFADARRGISHGPDQGPTQERRRLT